MALYTSYTPAAAEDQVFETQSGILYHEVAADGPTTVAALIDAVLLAGDPASFTPTGKAPVPATSAEAKNFVITAKPCGTLLADGATETTIDFFNVVDAAGGTAASDNYMDDAEGGVSLDAVIELKAGARYCLSACFEVAYDKTAFAALP